MSVVLITGCSSGFGMLAALEFARRGDTVYATMRDTAKAGRLRREAEASGVSVEVLQLDVDDRESVQAAIAEVIRQSGKIDVLVNNAGIGKHGPVEDFDDDEVRSVFETNVFGVIRVTRAVMPHMRSEGNGTIVNVGSIAGKVTAPFGGIYSASKHATLGLIRSAAAEVARRGVTVNAICPGYVDTPMTEAVLTRIEAQTGLTSAESRAALEKQSPQNRMFEPAEVADLCAYLASDAAHGITGQAINLDGGQYAY